jgi:di- and tripeptidase
LYTCSANGWVQVCPSQYVSHLEYSRFLRKRWSAQFTCTASWRAHAGIVLSSIVTNTTPSSTLCGADGEKVVNRGWCLVTSANDNEVKVFSALAACSAPPERGNSSGKLIYQLDALYQRRVVYSMRIPQFMVYISTPLHHLPHII